MTARSLKRKGVTGGVGELGTETLNDEREEKRVIMRTVDSN